MKKGLFIGRFQPFHRGHLNAVKQALRQVDFLIIGIGSSQEKRTPENPWSALERKKMIAAALQENSIAHRRFRIIRIPDIHDDAKWPAHARDVAGPFDVLFTRSPIVKALFKKYSGIPVIWLKKEIDVSATTVRRKMKKGGNWKDDLPLPVVRQLITLRRAVPMRATNTPSSAEKAANSRTRRAPSPRQRPKADPR